MKAFLLIFILLATPPLFAKKRLKIESEPEYKSPIKGVRSPIKTFKALRKDLPNSSDKGVSFQKCSIYSKYLVHETNSGQIGSDTISIRRFGPGDAFEKVCDKKVFAKEIPLKAEAQVFEGANENFVFTRSADNSGEESSLWIYDALNGDELYRADYNFKKEFTVKASGSGLVLSYFARLDLPCSLGTADADKCWEETLQKNKIPPGAGLKKPDCQEVFAKSEFQNSEALLKNPRAVQIFAPVKVTVTPAALKAGNKKSETNLLYVHGTATCNMAP